MLARRRNDDEDIAMKHHDRGPLRRPDGKSLVLSGMMAVVAFAGCGEGLSSGHEPAPGWSHGAGAASGGVYLTMARDLGLDAAVESALSSVVPAVLSDTNGAPGFAQHGDDYEVARRALADAIVAAGNK